MAARTGESVFADVLQPLAICVLPWWLFLLAALGWGSSSEKAACFLAFVIVVPMHGLLHLTERGQRLVHATLTGVANQFAWQFSLRKMLLIVGLVAVLLGGNVRRVHERRQLLAPLEPQGVVVLRVRSADDCNPWNRGGYVASVSPLRVLLGDVPVAMIYDSRDRDVTNEERQLARQLFPEAISVFGQYLH